MKSWFRGIFHLCELYFLYFFCGSFASFLDQLKSGRPQSASAGADSQSSVTPSATSSVAGSSGGVPPGLSESALKRFSSDIPPSPDDLEKVMNKYCVVLP